MKKNILIIAVVVAVGISAFLYMNGTFTKMNTMTEEERLQESLMVKEQNPEFGSSPEDKELIESLATPPTNQNSGTPLSDELMNSLQVN